MWSCGVILSVILTGYLPFDDRNIAVLYLKVFEFPICSQKFLPLRLFFSSIHQILLLFSYCCLLGLAQIFKGEFETPKWLSHGAANLIRRILDPNPTTRITVDEIKADNWFKQDYMPVIPYDDDEDDTKFNDAALAVKEV